MNIRGMLQFLLIGTFFGVRYVFDVMLTPAVLDSLVRAAMHATRDALSSAWPLIQAYYAPLMPFVILHMWRWCSADAMQQMVLMVCTLRLVTSILVNDSVTIGHLTKGSVWPLLVPLVRFARVSAGRVTRRAAHPSLQHWLRGYRCHVYSHRGLSALRC